VQSPRRLKIGVDTGGTFTDIVLFDDATGELTVGKTLTTSDDPSRAIDAGIGQTLALADARLGDAGQIIHGTTLVTNAIIERKGSRTALLTTRGFRDAVEIAREHRYDLYDLMLEMPRPLTPRHLRFDVPERTRADGAILEPLDVAHVAQLARELADAGIEAVAIAFLNSFANPEAERAARDVVARVAPELRVSLSSDVVPEIREYERTSTTIANAYVQDVVARYLRDLESRLARGGFEGMLLLMLSSGGLATADTAARFPVRLLESGPAAGALAAAAVGGAAGHADLLSFDMGGTTAKFAVIAGGRPLVAHAFEVDRRYRFKKGSGLPISLPVIEMIEIGAGGGSIARVDALGLLKVGPDSAGADPGPACYGRGGDQPTVTDADLVLGYLDPAFFLGGEMALDAEAAREAIGRQVAEPLGLSVEAAAWGIHQIVNEQMASAARVHALERGTDPRTLPLYAFGGAGPVHGARVAAALGSPALVAPYAAGVMSAIGFLNAPLAFDFVRSAPGRLDELDWTRVSGLLAAMEAEGAALLAAAGLKPADVSHQRSADMRYVGQGHEVRVTLPPGKLDRAAVPALREAFETEYRRLYGREGPPVAVEAITWRVVSSGPIPNLRLHPAESATAIGDARKGTRRAWMPETGGLTDVPVYDRYRLRPDEAIAGPAIVEERESTLVVPPHGRCVVDRQWNLVVRVDERAPEGDPA
jgi:N-methylhydantoinase A